MILNGPIILSFFVAVIGLLLGLAASGVWLRRSLVREAEPSGGEPSGRGLEGEGAYLVFLLLLTAFGLRTIAWPLSYLALSSAVPHVSGAMCIFGVTRLCPLWANLLQTARPLLVLFLGGWIVLRLSHAGLERRNPGRARQRSPLEPVLFFVSLVLLLLDCLLEIVVLLSLRPDQPVYCCGSVYDLPGRFSALLPGSIFGAQHAQLALPLLSGSVMLCAVLSLAAGLSVIKGWWDVANRPRLASLVALALLLLLPLLVLLAGIVAMEVITPRLTGLPYHHCLYCLLGKTAQGPWMAVTLAVGLLCAAWGGLLLFCAAGRGDGDQRPAGTLLVAGGLSLLLFLGVVLPGMAASRGGGELGRCPGCGSRLFDTVYLVEVVCGTEDPRLFCSPGCALAQLKGDVGGAVADCYVTVRDEFTGKRLDSGAAFFVQAAEEIPGLPPGNRWHAYQYLENAHIMAFELDGNVVADPFLPGAAIDHDN